MAVYRGRPAFLSHLFLSLLCLSLFPTSALSLYSHSSSKLQHAALFSSRHPSLGSREVSAAAGASGSGDFTCGPDKPCSNGACCGDSGWCGYGDTYCGKGCQSNCDAKAECGKNAAVPGQGCPLNVCCSEFGFCGTTSEFCGASCQSNCEQPKPKSSASNPKKRVVGYWEAWNSQHACGTMSIGEIPVNYLTHLIVAFGYIDSSFRITNMDGLTSEVYRNVGEIKARNPGLKIMIALGGWTFNDPGTWQSVFPTLVSSQANRATFIRNLLGFMSEYGYDGVDFDWEYPGAKDRGGSDKDGENYTSLMKELRRAITASGRDYIMTFTAPTSYWYLRHFDIKNMSEHVDWINLMSYDLHGVWDGDNPIGKHILSHTNLTEIDLALDLFWRVDVDPSSIVLGLGFYGRSFTLASSSCWKPGCLFTGPGAAGPCTGTAGILSYKEIKDILQSTGATSYLDKAAAARYLVYDDNSWISYDDSVTIKAKIDYASKLGLSGLMIWAIDLDDGDLSALRAVSDPSMLDSVDSEFDLVDLDRLFPKQYLPAAGTKPKYGLVTFGGSQSTDPSSSAFGFLLVAGDSHVVSSLRKRDGEPEPFVFVDCPEDVLDLPTDQVRTARVTCVNGDVEGCYQIMERGVEGTIVEMPDSCAPNQLARAISLTTSNNQTIPESFSRYQRSSQVFDFSFDFNFKLVRRDSNNTSVRMDYSNTKGYWDQLVDSPGIQARDLKDLDERFFAPSDLEWNTVYDSEEVFTFDPESATKIKKDLSAPLFWQTVDGCDIDGLDYSEGFGAYVNGHIDASFYYGFSLIGTMKDGSWDAKQSHGFLQVRGQSDFTYGMGGIGTVDITRGGGGNPATVSENKIKLGGNTIQAGHINGFASFQPYYQVDYQLGTFNGTDRELSEPAASFNGRLSARIVSDFGKFQANFPVEDHSDPNRYGDKREKDQIELGSDNVLYGTSSNGGAITIGSMATFGLNIDFFLFGDLFRFKVGLPDLSLTYHTLSTFTFYPSEKESDKSCIKYEVGTNVVQITDNADSIGWSDPEGLGSLVEDLQTPAEGATCFKNAEGSSNSKRALTTESTGSDSNETLSTDSAQDDLHLHALSSRASEKMPGWGLSPRQTIDKDILGIGENFGAGVPEISCVNCEGCRTLDEESGNQCCGCKSMQLKWGFDDIPKCEDCDLDDEFPDWQTSVIAYISGLNKRNVQDDQGQDQDQDEGNDTETRSSHELHRRKDGYATMSTKPVKLCPATKKERIQLQSPYKYPAFPKDRAWAWDNIQNNKWESISRYWGNSSGLCQFWGVTGLTTADKEWVTDATTGSTTQVRADYQTEHVYEGQLIGDFFTEWLDKGYINKQSPMPSNPTSKVPCTWTQQWIKAIPKNSPWKIKKFQAPYTKAASFAQLIVSELGSEDHLDRLAIFLARPNRKKGGMFTGNQPNDPDVYVDMPQDEQLASVKDIGLIFNYLNNKEIWKKYCSVYEAIYDHMGDFDDYYTKQGSGVTVPSLQKEWKEYNRVVLDSLVRRSRATLKFMYENKKCGSFGCLITPNFARIWTVNYLINYYQIKISDTCQNMDKSTV